MTTDTSDLSRVVQRARQKRAAAEQPTLELDSLFKGFSASETGGESNPWLRTRVRPDGGSTAFGPVQITGTLFNDFHTRHPELFKGHEDFVQKFQSQNELFKRFGNEPELPGYHPRYDYGGAGDYANDTDFQSSYNEVARRIMEQRMRNRGVWPVPATEAGVRAAAGKWIGHEPDRGYMQRMLQSLGLTE